MRKIVSFIVMVGVLFWQMPVSAGMSAREALYHFAHEGDVSALKRLKQEGYSFEMADQDGNSALCESVYNKDYSSFALLKQMGASVSHPCVKKIPPETVQQFNEGYTTWANAVNAGEIEYAGTAIQAETAAEAASMAETTAAGVTSTNMAAITGTNVVATTTGLSTAAIVGASVGALALVGGGIALAVSHGGGSHNNSVVDLCAGVVCPAGQYCLRGVCVGSASECNGHGLISQITGKCLCTDGYTGDNCETAPTWDNPCTSVNCGAYGVCLTDTASCLCTRGYTGDHCEIEPVGGCNVTGCGVNGTCNPTTGLCRCNIGWTGPTCDQKLDGPVESTFCPVNYYGTAPSDCHECPANSSSILGTATIQGCFCNSGYVRFGNACFEEKVCGLNAHQEEANCVCNTGYSGDPDTECTASLPCGANEVQEGSKCVCVTGYIRNSSGVCVAAEGDLILSTASENHATLSGTNDLPRNVYGMKYSGSGTLTNYRGTIDITNNSHGNVWGMYQAGTDYTDNGGLVKIVNNGNGNIYGMYAANSEVWDMCNAYHSDGKMSIKNTGDGDVYGMYSTYKTSMHNAWGVNGLMEIINQGNGNVYGMYGVDEMYNLYNTYTPVNAVMNLTNNGTGTVYGMYNASADGKIYHEKLSEGQNNALNITNLGSGNAVGLYTNGGTVKVSNYLSIDNKSTGAAYGIYGEAGSKVQIDTNGVIQIKTNDTAKTSYGVYVKENSVVSNKGKIIIDGSENAYGIWAGKNSTILNTGTVQIENWVYSGAAPYANFIYIDNGGTFLNGGVVSASSSVSMAEVDALFSEPSSLDLDALASKGKMSLIKGGNFKASSIKGKLYINPDNVQNGFETQYIAKDAITANDTSKLNLISESALFNAKLSGNGHDVVMQMKGFDSVTDNATLAKFLATNYALGNNEAFYNKLKSFGSMNALTDSLNKLTGKDMLSRFNFEDMTMMRELNYDMNEKLFNSKEQHFAVAGSVSPMAFKGDSGSNARYSLYNKRNGNSSIGLGIAFTDIRSDDDHNDNNRSESMYQLVLPMGYKTHGLNLMTSPRIGYARGSYDRTGFDGSSYDGTIEKRVFGLMNEARYPMTVGKWKFEPAAEFNILGYQQKGHEDSKEFALKIQNQNTYSVEGGIGLYATREEDFGGNGTLKLTSGVVAYHEFADPYRLRVGMEGMNGDFTLRDEKRSNNRAVVRAGFNYNKEDLSLYGTLMSYIDKEIRSSAKTGINWKF